MAKPPSTSNNPQQPSTNKASNQMDAIDQMFAEFQLIYNNQYHKAFPTTDKLKYAKKLWYSNLKDYSGAMILDAAHKAIKDSEFLPTVHGVIKYIEKPPALFTSLPEITDKLSKEEKLLALAKLRKETGL